MIAVVVADLYCFSAGQRVLSIRAARSRAAAAVRPCFRIMPIDLKKSPNVPWKPDSLYSAPISFIAAYSPPLLRRAPPLVRRPSRAPVACSLSGALASPAVAPATPFADIA